MMPGDFQSMYQGQSGQPSLSADPRLLAMEIVRRDHGRTRVLAALASLLWLAGTAGMLVLVIGLNQLVLFIRIADWDKASSITRPSTTQPFVLSTWDQQMLEGTSFIHHSMPWVGGSIIALLLAALFTVLLVFSSRQATLSRINMSLMMISEQLRRMQPGVGPAPEASYAPMPPPTNTFEIRPKRTNLVIIGVLVLMVLMLGTCLVGLLWFLSSARAGGMWRDYPRLSPFQATHWSGETATVQVNGTSYELLGLDDQSTAAIVAECKSLDPPNWQKRFDEDLVEVLDRTGHHVGPLVTLRVRDPNTLQETVLTNVPMTEENRAAIWQARNVHP
jgi:hypothetical protein